jgi:hypothetical protein
MNRFEEENRRADYRSGEKGLQINFQPFQCTTSPIPAPQDLTTHRA